LHPLPSPSPSIDLSGEWRFATDESDARLASSPEQWQFPEKIHLPGQIAAQGFGEKPSIRTKWTGDGWRYPELFKEWQADEDFKMPFFLQPPRHYVAPAWYQKDIEIPASWSGQHALLHLERVHRQTTAWVNGEQVGPEQLAWHAAGIAISARSAGKHTLTLRIDNRIMDVNPGPHAHSVTDHTQGNGTAPASQPSASKKRASSKHFAPKLVLKKADLEAMASVMGMRPNRIFSSLDLHSWGGNAFSLSLPV